MSWREAFPEDYAGPIHQLGSFSGHNCYMYFYINNEFKARCECGSTWTYSKEATMEYMQSIYSSHLRYFNRPKMETL